MSIPPIRSMQLLNTERSHIAKCQTGGDINSHPEVLVHYFNPSNFTWVLISP